MRARRVWTAVALFVFTAGMLSAGDEVYKLGPDSQLKPDVPHGKVQAYRWTESKVYPGTIRDYWVYVPAQYNGSEPAAVMVFQDGKGYLDEKGNVRAGIVFDNLIAAKQIPLIIGIFVNPGQILPAQPGQTPRSNRSVEYDTLNDQYARFLIEEILPAVGKEYRLTDDPAKRAICGISSGGICAFTVAWERPDAFHKVVSHVGSFTNIRGGHVYPAVIRKTERKPLRISLQDGSGDLDNVHGNWPLANQEMAAALKFAGYDYQFVFGEGMHSNKHGGAIFPETMRWLWRPEIVTATPAATTPAK
ncbi:MAG: alpha/beta hydrolase-fold protein [Planctomycetales bacterium]